MSQITRITDLIGSFVSRDFKRKRLEEDEDGGKPDKSPSKRAKHSTSATTGVNNSQSSAEFLKRVSTFKDFVWCRDIPALSPLEIARRGWVATGDDFMVRCVSCAENLSLALPALDTGVRDQFIKTAVSRLSTAHAEFCPWAACPSPLDWTRVQEPDMNRVVVNACRISQLGEKLPFIKDEIQRSWEPLLKKVDCELLNEIDCPKVKSTSCLLSLCGWRLGLVEDTLEDAFAVRRIGVWNFVSLQDEEDLQEARRVSKEIGGTLDDSGELQTPEGKEYFDPVGEHMSWHPLLLKRDGVPGWKLIVRQSQVKSLGEEKRAEETVQEEEPAEGFREKRDSFRMIRRVRDLIDQW